MIIQTVTTAKVSFAEIGLNPDIHYYNDWLGYDEGWFDANRRLTIEEVQVIKNQITEYGDKLLGPKTNWSLSGALDQVRDVEYRKTKKENHPHD